MRPGPWPDGPRLTLELGGLEAVRRPGRTASSSRCIATVVGVAPAFVIMVTSFTRLIIVLHFVRQALGTQCMPPNQVLAGLALFLTFFVMMPVATRIQDSRPRPYQDGELDAERGPGAGAGAPQAVHAAPDPGDGHRPVRGAGQARDPAEPRDHPLRVVLPAFVLSELKTAFQIGFLLFVPFLVIDMVVASVLVSMGMLMLPPVVVSFPFKILLFVLVDGWSLVIGSTLRSFCLTIRRAGEVSAVTKPPRGRC